MRHPSPARSLRFACALLLLLLTAIPAAAEEKPKAPADPGKEAVKAARAFFRAFVKSDDKAAYELTAPAYREAVPADKFAEQMKAAREGSNLQDMPPVSGWVLLKPKEGEPRRALIAGGGQLISRRSPRPIMRDGKPDHPSTVGLELTETKDGRWLVTDVRELKMEQGGGRLRFAPGMAARDWSEPIRGSSRKDRAAAREVGSAVKGVIAEVKPGSVTVKLQPSEFETDGTVERTFKVDDKTSVAIGMQEERQTPGGRKGTVQHFRFADAASLKAGMEATIEPGDDDDYAADIRTMQGPGAGGPGL